MGHCSLQSKVVGVPFETLGAWKPNGSLMMVPISPLICDSESLVKGLAETSLGVQWVVAYLISSTISWLMGCLAEAAAKTVPTIASLNIWI